MSKSFIFIKKYSRLVTLFTLSLSLVIIFQNCTSGGFSSAPQVQVNTQSNLNNTSDQPAGINSNSGNTKNCSLNNVIYNPGNIISGYIISSAVAPALCGSKVTRTCLSTGAFDGSVPLSTNCNQQCLHPDSSQAVNSGTLYTYYIKNSGATQADCEAAKVVSTCSESTGQFSPSLPVTRYATCLVSGQTCAYANNVTGYSIPTGNMTGDKVTGYIGTTATYPSLCGNQITSTCQSNGAWSAQTPLYTSCSQKCLHPDSKQPVDQNTVYTYYTLQSGTQTQCNAAKLTSTCSATNGVFSPLVPTTRYDNCTIILAPTISFFSASNSIINSGASTELTWKTVNASQIKLNGVDVTNTSSKNVLPTVTTSYTLSVTNSAGSVSSQLTITVNPIVNPPPVDTSTSNVTILFPPPSATSDSKIIVRGKTATQFNVSSLSVNGVSATSSDNFKTWRAEVPLNVGTNLLQVSALQNGQSLSQLASVNVERFSSENSIKRGTGEWPGRSLGLSYEASKNRMIMGDDLLDGAYEVDVTTGNRKILSSSETPRLGSGYESVQPNQMVSQDNKAYLYDNVGNGVIFSIDLTNGNQAIIHQPSAGITSLCFSADKKSIFTFGGGSGSEVLTKLDLATLSATTISSKSIGTGTDMRNGSQITCSATRNKIYLSIYYSDTIVAIDSLTGVRSTFSQATGSEPKLTGSALEAHDESGKVFTLESGKLIAMDMNTGRRNLMPTNGPLSSLTSYHAFGMSPWGPLLVDYFDDYYPSNSSGSRRTPTIFVIDPIEGTRVILSR